ncbi:hypothetical protein QBC34DRAFT_392943 [Podospora aff. communis PSN243]|uniref:SMP-30/Gluconolactonase/LRE-like region domain-containing protein n=1 Tax=Podospora aff. communis PSN243 TaxID=3040156 RepID=A0AAV9H2T2_9PEZI|nr:hypothetical protein QBC34DRAFT_392943 [Podospora aff. communis PSN243]
MQAGLITSIVLTVVAFVALWTVGILARLGYLGPGAKPFPNPFLRLKTPFNAGTAMESGMEMPSMPPTVKDEPPGEDIYNDTPRASPTLKPKRKLREMVPPSAKNWAKIPVALVRGDMKTKMLKMPPRAIVPDEEDVVKTSWLEDSRRGPIVGGNMIAGRDNIVVDSHGQIYVASSSSSRGQGSVRRKEVPKRDPSRGRSRVPRTPSPMGAEDGGHVGRVSRVSEASSDHPREPRGVRGVARSEYAEE